LDDRPQAAVSTSDSASRAAEQMRLPSLWWRPALLIANLGLWALLIMAGSVAYNTLAPIL
jgi:hypothetical protein